MAPNSSTLVWKIPWTEEPGSLQSMGLQIVGHDWPTEQQPAISCPNYTQGTPSINNCGGANLSISF